MMYGRSIRHLQQSLSRQGTVLFSQLDLRSLQNACFDGCNFCNPFLITGCPVTHATTHATQDVDYGNATSPSSLFPQSTSQNFESESEQQCARITYRCRTRGYHAQNPSRHHSAPLPPSSPTLALSCQRFAHHKRRAYCRAGLHNLKVL